MSYYYYSSSLRVALRSIYSIHPSSPPSINTGSRKMATLPGHSQDATTGEEIASTTIPPKEPQPKQRNACTLSPGMFAFPTLS